MATGAPNADLMRLAEPPSDAAVAAALEGAVVALRRRYGTRLRDVRLFGSRGRGDARPESDADVAVVLADGAWSAWEEKVALIPLTDDLLARWGLYVQFWVVPASDVGAAAVEPGALAAAIVEAAAAFLDRSTPSEDAP